MKFHKFYLLNKDRQKLLNWKAGPMASKLSLKETMWIGNRVGSKPCLSWENLTLCLKWGWMLSNNIGIKTKVSIKMPFLQCQTDLLFHKRKIQTWSKQSRIHWKTIHQERKRGKRNNLSFRNQKFRNLSPMNLQVRFKLLSIKRISKSS